MLKIEDILREDFDWENVEIDENEFDELENQLIINYLSKNSPKERQLLAIDWNFDNSKEVIKWIAEQPDTDKGTALFLYWYMNPQFFKKYENRKECEEEDSWALEDFDIVETLEKNYISGYYKNQKYKCSKCDRCLHFNRAKLILYFSFHNVFPFYIYLFHYSLI